MKNKLNYLFSVMCFLVLVLSCRDPLLQEINKPDTYIPQGKGAFFIVIEKINRTVLPEPGDNHFAAYRLEIKNVSTDTIAETITRTRLNISDPFSLFPGEYSIDVLAYADEGMNNLAARTLQPVLFEITEGAATPVSIELNALQGSSGLGSFSWDITLPPGLSTATMEIINHADGTQAGDIVTLMSLPAGIRENLPAGFYRLIIRLEKDNTQPVILRVLLHIYDNLESIYEAVFTDDHFNKILYEVSFNINGTVHGPYDYFHGELIDVTPFANTTRPTAAGLYSGTPPTQENINGWLYNGEVWDAASDRIIQNMALTARWDTSRIDISGQAGSNPVEQAITYAVANAAPGLMYTLLVDAAATNIGAQNIDNANFNLTITGMGSEREIQPSVFTITSGTLILGENIFVNGNVTVMQNAGITLTVNARINSLTLNSYNADSGIVNITPNWTGSVSTLNLRGQSNLINNVITFWDGKPVFQSLFGSLDPLIVNNFTLGQFICSDPLVSPQNISPTHRIVFDAAVNEGVLEKIQGTAGGITITVTPLSGPGFTWNSNGNNNNEIVIYRLGGQDSVTITLGITGNYERIEWWCNGVPLHGDNTNLTSMTLDANSSAISDIGRKFLTIIVMRDGVPTSLFLEFEVRLAGNLNSMISITSLLNIYPGGDNVNNPIPLSVALELGNMTTTGSGWQQLLQTIADAGKFVTLDLSNSPMTGTVFNPFTNIATGEDRIVSLVLPDVAESIPDSNICCCDNPFLNLEFVRGNNVKSIGYVAFAGCTSLTSADFPLVESIGDMAFLSTGLTSLVLPASVTAIGEAVFWGCINLTDIQVDVNNPYFSSLNGILYNKTQTTILAAPAVSGSFVIPNSVTAVGDYAFAGNSALTNITMPNGVTTIGSDAFSNCSALTSIIFEGTTPPALNSAGVFHNTHVDLRIYLPAGSAAAYRAAANWNADNVRSRIHSVGCGLPNAAAGEQCGCL
jgi:hypothetical protein